MRVYLPATTTALRMLVDDGVLRGPHTGYAVTDRLRGFYDLTDGDADVEELEYAALLAAARGSLRLLDLDPLATRRRVVVAADVPDPAVHAIDEDEEERGAVRIEADVRLRDVASAHIDGAEAEADVSAAVAVVLEADLGSDDARFVVDQAEGHELAWYASQELGPVLELL